MELRSPYLTLQVTFTLTVLAGGGLEDLVLVGVPAHQAVDGHLLGLPYPVAPGHGLQVVLQHAQRQV